MAEWRDPSFTIVEYMADHSGYECGYCKNKNTNFSHGMWSHRMGVGDYQDLIDRGWRRSGKYCYKPTMNKTCCPMYTIKCDALELKLSKSQKKILKRMHRYLSYGDMKEDQTIGSDSSTSTMGNSEFVTPKFESKRDLSSVTLSTNDINTTRNIGSFAIETNDGNMNSNKTPVNTETQKSICVPEEETAGGASQDLKAGSTGTRSKPLKAGAGPNPNKPPCRKAKDIRRERREAKRAKFAHEAVARGESPMQTKETKSSTNQKTLEDYINEPLPENPAHTLEVKLVRSQPSSAEFLRTFKTAHQVYERYQVNIHGDTPDRCSESQYKRFLCNSPLEPWQPPSGPLQGYGSFHHQYWLDGRLIAVGVLDVLPHCLSSVYLYYDPEFSFLSLGTYASLRELALTRELQRRVSSLKWYYMGFYIHSCPKMRYKGKYTPSFLLCPETYVWVPIEKSLPKLELAKYSRLHEDPSAVDENGQVDICKIPVLHEDKLLRYGMYPSDDEDEIKEYATLVGEKCAYSIMLYRS
ncbi:arginyl-tRNA--protein transferase 1-like isoform X3 [Homarus americanus]|uniref:Arginyl-tRNA--protein transferase 1 n=1 Tax=Homarus americanus TaxID=6706 RepID=A0A8J5N6P0_HOMAM|nr:arginyl-tRNA--protein transferase 1-like isoform X3 [Homarus americanus]KAG7174311.1 Arginyl-tRNA--protein transferase 1-like [Homarus americanus]